MHLPDTKTLEEEIGHLLDEIGRQSARIHARIRTVRALAHLSKGMTMKTGHHMLQSMKVIMAEVATDVRLVRDDLIETEYADAPELAFEWSELAVMAERLHMALEDRIHSQLNAGYRGWDDPDCKQAMLEKMASNIKERDWLDVVALASFMWWQECVPATERQ